MHLWTDELNLKAILKLVILFFSLYRLWYLAVSVLMEKVYINELMILMIDCKTDVVLSHVTNEWLSSIQMYAIIRKKIKAFWGKLQCD